MLAGTGLREASGSEWYFPARLTLDTGAVNNGIETPSQKVLGLQTTMGTQLPKSLHILAIDSELDKLFGGGSQTVLAEAEAMAEQNGISSENVKLIDRLNEYSHNDPAGALAEEHEGVEANVFLKELRRRRHTRGRTDRRLPPCRRSSTSRMQSRPSRRASGLRAPPYRRALWPFR
jgi:hypothetical protein